MQLYSFPLSAALVQGFPVLNCMSSVFNQQDKPAIEKQPQQSHLGTDTREGWCEHHSKTYPSVLCVPL